MFGLIIKEDPNLKRNREVQILREQQRRDQQPKNGQAQHQGDQQPKNLESEVEPGFFHPISQNRFRART